MITVEVKIVRKLKKKEENVTEIINYGKKRNNIINRKSKRMNKNFVIYVKKIVIMIR